MTHIIQSGAERIATERARQITDEGRTAEHDAAHKQGALTMAAIVYATAAASSPDMRKNFRDVKEQGLTLRHWPWEAGSFKIGADDGKDSRIRELTKAGALIAAEIDRLLKQSH
jgi:hypothetical protein